MFLNVGSAVTGPEVYLKALSMARNVAAQHGTTIRDFTTAVFDLVELPGNFRQGPPSKDHPQYYYRPWKTILVRTVADGGRSYLLLGRPGVDDSHACGTKQRRACRPSSREPLNSLRPGSASMSLTTQSQRGVILDRDGTLMADTGFVHRVADLRLLDGVVPGLRRLADLGFRLMITTNQSGVARGLFSEAEMHAFNECFADG